MIILFMIIYGVIVNLIIYPILIPDYCYFHNHETSTTVELFFDFPAYEGFHPVPSKVGYLLVGTLGLILGLLFFKIINPKRNGASTND